MSNITVLVTSAMGLRTFSSKMTTHERSNESDIPNPYKLNLSLSGWIAIPSYVILAVSSTTLLYMIYKHFRSLLEIYISVIFYLIAQLLFLLILTTSWISELIHPEETQDKCQIKLALQSFAVTLPGYSILIITISRVIFLSSPLSYLSYLKLNFQLLSFMTAGLICGLISIIPLLGVCPARPLVLEEAPWLEICSHGDRREPSCAVFYSVLLVLGFLLPVLAVISLYIYIYKVVLTARKSHLKLSSTASATTSTTVEGGESVNQRAEQRIELRKERTTEQRTERRSVPWSILAILVMTVSTTVPWGVMTLFTVEMTKLITAGGDVSLTFDLLYSLLQVLIGCSPLVYLLTTNSLRTVVVKNIRRVVGVI